MRLRIKQDQQGISNVIVVMLSLVLVAVIVANVVLWSYQMNQFDWERMQERVKILNVTRAAPEGWYNGAWEYRTQVIVNNTFNPSSLTDFQVWVSVDTASLIDAGKMRADCGDIRFTDSDGVTLLGYWIESGINSSNTKIWVKIPLIPANSTKIVYLYYGNPNATSMSNINDVLEGSYIKIDVEYRWAPRLSTVDEANGNDVGSWKDIPFSFPFWREPKTRVYICSNGFGIFDPTPSTNDHSDSLRELKSRWKIAPFWDNLRTDRKGGIVSEPGVYVDSYSDHVVITWETTRYGDSRDSIKFQMILYSNGDIRINIDNATNFADFTPTLGISKGDDTNYIDVTAERDTSKSWLFLLRKYASPEPTTTIGTEETLGPGIFLELENAGSLTLHIVSLWIINSTVHQRYDISVFVNSGETLSYRVDVCLPSGEYVVKVVTERGNVAVYSGS